MDIDKLVASDPDILSGQTVFAGTRVPVETLFDHLEAGVSLDEFLDDFPTVTKEQAVALLEAASVFVLNAPVNTYAALTLLSVKVNDALAAGDLPAGPIAIQMA